MFVEAPTPCLKKAPNFAKGDTAFCFFFRQAINDRPYNIKNALPGVFHLSWFFITSFKMPATSFGGFIITIFITTPSNYIQYADQQNNNGQRYYHNVIRQKEREQDA